MGRRHAEVGSLHRLGGVTLKGANNDAGNRALISPQVKRAHSTSNARVAAHATVTRQLDKVAEQIGNDVLGLINYKSNKHSTPQIVHA
jgi:hypothetical protein